MEDYPTLEQSFMAISLLWARADPQAAARVAGEDVSKFFAGADLKHKCDGETECCNCKLWKTDNLKRRVLKDGCNSRESDSWHLVNICRLCLCKESMVTVEMLQGRDNLERALRKIAPELMEFADPEHHPILSVQVDNFSPRAVTRRKMLGEAARE